MLRETLFRGPPQDVARLSKFLVLSGLLAQAGIEMDGPQPWDMRIHSPDLPAHLLAQGSLGLGESDMDGEWDADCLDEFFARLLRARLGERVQPARIVMHALSAHLFNGETRRRAAASADAGFQPETTVDRLKC
jgi:cyclopropane-fatty-acyl-phospholipid synthase